MITKNDNVLEVPIENFRLFKERVLNNFIADAYALNYKDISLLGGNFYIEVLTEDDDIGLESDEVLVELFSNQKQTASFCLKGAAAIFTKETAIIDGKKVVYVATKKA